ncbi:hypothetical protein [Paenarthrobacter aurescens]|uniref:hypothetical protein n=1 Tax=Paenarthrobacter aurescens TaxID=43663 RepID=UPI001FE6E7D0|nr:hypothetical protein [Paenarthrobacter aurescens]MDO6145351.1 hypothetical protein [Paenarthrobacter aurescens]MDO6149156.1 hypothetical protein [Paenarthrobacter aurescens]MDO6160400.1 hypothetical protein [Paenarthrobacter aurescens]MDO6164259.1 hypothetical protein [Paenarthrobacter aurescens]
MHARTFRDLRSRLLTHGFHSSPHPTGQHRAHHIRPRCAGPRPFRSSPNKLRHSIRCGTRCATLAGSTHSRSFKHTVPGARHTASHGA